MCKSGSIFPYLQVLRYINDFWNLFLDKVDLKMNHNSFGEKLAIIWFYSINVKGNSAHLAGKNSRAGAKITIV